MSDTEDHDALRAERDELVAHVRELQAEMTRMGTDAEAAIAAEAKAVRQLEADLAHMVHINRTLRDRPDLAERAPLVMSLVAERDALRRSVAGYKEFTEGEILDRISAELGLDLRHQMAAIGSGGASASEGEDQEQAAWQRTPPGPGGVRPFSVLSDELRERLKREGGDG